MSVAYNPNNRPAAPHGRPDSIVSDISEEGPDTTERRTLHQYAPSVSSDQSYNYQRRVDSTDNEDSSYRRGPSNGNPKLVPPSQASENGDTSLSEIAEAYKNQAVISGAASGRRTPRAYERGEVTSEVIEGLKDEIERLRITLEVEQDKREEMKAQLSKWKDNIAHNTKAYIQNAQVDLHKNHMRIYPLLNDDGVYPDMVVFPTTVGTFMKMNEAHLTRLVVFYGLQSDPGMNYYAKYCALRDHLGISP